MYLTSSRPATRLRWVFVYTVWIFAEVLSLSPFAYSIFAIVIWILGDISGPAFFIGIIPGYVLSKTIISLDRRSKHPWQVGDYVSHDSIKFQISQIRLFHTIMWCDGVSGATPHRKVSLYHPRPKTRLNGFGVLQDPRSYFYQFTGWGGFTACLWPIFCEIFVFGIFFLSGWFMFWTGAKAAISFTIGSLLPLSVLNIYSRSKIKGGGEFADEIVLPGSTWMIMDIYGTFRLRLFMLYELTLELNSEFA